MTMAASLLPQFWYVVAESHEVTADKVLARQVLDEWLACYRDAQGQVVVAQDRCIHRCARLSSGSVQEGKLTCRYHGWVYGNGGQVECIPVEVPGSANPGSANPGSAGVPPASVPTIKAKTYRVVEQEGYVYVNLQVGLHTPVKPRSLSEVGPANGRVLRGVVRLQNRFQNSLANCVENYIDVPHTAYVHHGIFRKPKGEALRTTVTRDDGEVHIIYHGEKVNLGTFGWFLNPEGKEIVHTDHFYAPNVTSVHYHLPCGYRYSITSQSIPVSAMETLVYTDISYDFGFWTAFAGWLVRREAQKVILQDIDILNEQGRSIEKYGERFYPTSADAIHTLTSEIIDGLKDGVAPSKLSIERQEITFCV